jgi:glycosyltransferase involved in cell wall biosynthesis
MRTVIIVSPYFPPSAQAGVHRARHLAKHLPAHGWQPLILRVDETCYEENLDYDLMSLVPETYESVAVSAIPASISRKFGFGDLGLRSYFSLRSALARLVKQGKPSLVFITGSPFYPLLLSRLVKRLGVPVVLDLQDPWVSEYGAGQPLWTKRGMSYRVARILEPLALRCASAVTSVSPTQNEMLVKRHDFLARVRVAAIPIGGDPEDFEELRRHPPAKLLAKLSARKVHLNYVGTHLPRSGPLVKKLFEALRELNEEEPELCGQLQLNFIGTSNQLRDVIESPVMQLAEELGVDGMVYEYPRRVPFLEALYWLASADGVLMIGSDERHYTASKIYPGLMSGKPFLSLFHSESTSHQLLSRARNGVAFGFTSDEELSSLVPALKEGLRKLAFLPDSFADPDPLIYRNVSADAIALEYAQLFSEVADNQ